MKKISLPLFLTLICYYQISYSQSTATGANNLKEGKASQPAKQADGHKLKEKWKAGPESLPGSIPAFEENKGEYLNPLNDWKVAYGCKNQGIQILFTEKGLVYSVPEVVPDKEDKDRDAKHNEQEEKEKKTKVVLHNVSMEWEGANQNPQITGEEETSYYFGALDPADPHKGIDHIRGYKKITYHNIYPGIDVEFSFAGGKVKYSISVKSGSNYSNYKMLFEGLKKLQINNSGDLVISTPVADITDKAPVTFEDGEQVTSSFVKSGGNEVSFSVGQSKMGRMAEGSPLVIDPTIVVVWYTHPLSVAYKACDVGMDQLNNTYTLGYDVFGNQYEQQFNPSGLLQWTYTLTSYAGAQSVSDLAVDKNGNSYIPLPYDILNTSGDYYGLTCITSAGALNYFYDNYANTNGAIFETWSITYSCAYDLLVQSGSPTILESEISTVNPANGNVGTVVANTTIGEIYTGCIAPNSYYYGLSANPSFSGNAKTNQLNCYDFSTGTPVLLWHMNSTYNFDDYEDKNNQSIAFNGIAAGCSYLYTASGDSLHQRDLANGNVIHAVMLPGGSDAAGSVNGGLAVDVGCGYVYAGTYHAMYVYDDNLNVITTTGLPGVVLGIAFNNDLVAVCGGQSSNSAPSDTGFVAVYEALSCGPQVTITANNSSCGLDNGSATANTTFCTGPYSYLWEPGGQTTQTISNLSAGTYTVTISPQGVCIGLSDTITITTTPGFTLTPSVTYTTGCRAIIGVTASGGGAPYTYLWSNGNTTDTIGVQPYGLYIVKVTDSSGGCTLTDTLQAAGGIVSIHANPALCSKDSSGSATITITGGNPPYTYSWSNGETTSSDTNLVTGTYTVTVTDGNGCSYTDAATVTTFPKPFIGANPGLDSICPGDTVALNAYGGVSYVWTPPSGLSCTVCPTPSATPTATTTYTVVGTDTNGCTNTATVTIKLLSAPVAAITGKDSVCAGYHDTLTVTGGAYYSWSTGATTSSINQIISSTTTFTVAVSNGTCVKDTSFTVHVIPTPIAAATASPDSVCMGDSTQLTAGGGSTYKWSTGNTQSSIWVVPTTETTYTLTAYAGTCSSYTTVTVGVEPLTTATISPIDSICPGDSALVSVTGSGGKFSYSWSTGSTTSSIYVKPTSTTTYTASVFGKCDTVNKTVTIKVIPYPTPKITGTNWKCKGVKDTLTVSSTTNPTTYKWSNGETTTTINTIGIDKDTTYYVIASNSLGCSDTTYFTITLRNPPAVTFTAAAVCAGECVTLDPKIISIPSPSSYKWSNGATTDTTTVCPDSTGAYTFTVSNGCPTTKSTTVDVYVPLLTACCDTVITKGDTVTLTAGSASGYSWSLLPPGSCDTCSSVKVSPATTTTYTVVGTDKHGCTEQMLITVIVDIPCFNFNVPNVFTPGVSGTSGLDSRFYIKTEDITGWSIYIYDRWGKEMFKSTDPSFNASWDGTTESGGNAPDGVYYYIINGTCQSTVYKKDGFVQLIR